MSMVDKIKEKFRTGKAAILADNELIAERIATCNSCEYLSGVRNCKQCGCFVDAKTKLKGAECPIGKW